MICNELQPHTYTLHYTYYGYTTLLLVLFSVLLSVRFLLHIFFIIAVSFSCSCFGFAATSSSFYSSRGMRGGAFSVLVVFPA
ncbi:hypothetical protein GE21DRAFT_1069102 [Neurospora crassa]|nr:hypothetical protein GE21DRAFT_1069102 [Neurospora crassa]